MNIVAVRQPSALIPLVMCVAALATVATHISRTSTAPQANEGTTAHVWQGLMAGQIPVIAFYSIKWLPREARTDLAVLAVQIGAAVAGLPGAGPAMGSALRSCTNGGTRCGAADALPRDSPWRFRPSPREKPLASLSADRHSAPRQHSGVLRPAWIGPPGRVTPESTSRGSSSICCSALNCPSRCLNLISGDGNR